MADDAHRPITAIVYADGAAFEALLDEAVRNLAARGLRLAGVVQQSIARPGRRKCDMVLRDLATGRLHPISEHRGEAAAAARSTSISSCAPAPLPRPG